MKRDRVAGQRFFAWLTALAVVLIAFVAVSSSALADRHTTPMAQEVSTIDMRSVDAIDQAIAPTDQVLQVSNPAVIVQQISTHEFRPARVDRRSGEFAHSRVGEQMFLRRTLISSGRVAGG